MYRFRFAFFMTILHTNWVHATLKQTSGKLKVLDLLLKNLHADGHRVLIFAQMTRTLDILQVCQLTNLPNPKDLVFLVSFPQSFTKYVPL